MLTGRSNQPSLLYYLSLTSTRFLCRWENKTHCSNPAQQIFKFKTKVVFFFFKKKQNSLVHIQCRNAALPLLFVCHCTWVVSTRHKSDLLFQREAQNKAQRSCSFWIFCCLQALLEIQTGGNQESSQCCTSFHPHPNAATNQLQSPTVQLPKNTQHTSEPYVNAAFKNTFVLLTVQRGHKRFWEEPQEGNLSKTFI